MAEMYHLQHQQADTMQQAGRKSNYQSDGFQKHACVNDCSKNIIYNNKGS